MLAQWQYQCQCPRSAALHCGISEASNVESFRDYLQAQLWRPKQQFRQQHTLSYLAQQPSYKSKQIMENHSSKFRRPPPLSWSDVMECTPRLLDETSFRLPPISYDDYPVYRTARQQQEISESAMRSTTYNQEIKDSAQALNHAASTSLSSFTSWDDSSYSTPDEVAMSREEAAADWLLTQPFNPEESIAISEAMTNVSQPQASNLTQTCTVEPSQLYKFVDQYNTNWSSASSLDDQANISEHEFYSTTPSDMDDDQIYDASVAPGAWYTDASASDMSGAMNSQWQSISPGAIIPQNKQAYHQSRLSNDQHQLVNSSSNVVRPSTKHNTDSRTREQKDKLLLDLHNQGLGYREIKAKGNFTEAESTLRGRVRVMTKPKHKRLRQPIWTDKDVKLLVEGVEVHRAQHPSGKLPWKTISAWMERNGASQGFGFGTCSKKYAQVMDRRRSGSEL